MPIHVYSKALLVFRGAKLAVGHESAARLPKKCYAGSWLGLCCVMYTGRTFGFIWLRDRFLPGKVSPRVKYPLACWVEFVVGVSSRMEWVRRSQ